MHKETDQDTLSKVRQLAEELGGEDGLALVDRLEAMKKEFGKQLHEMQIAFVNKHAPKPGVEQVEVATAMCEATSAAYAGLAASLGMIMGNKEPEEINALAVKSLRSNLATCWDMLDKGKDELKRKTAERHGENEYAAHG